MYQVEGVHFPEPISVDAEFGRADTSEYRAALLQIFKSVMDMVESTLGDDDLEKFRTARRQHYKTFVVQESVIDGNVCVETLNEVTGREIAAGRMPPDHSLRQLAEQGMAAPHFSRAELLQQASGKAASQPSIWRRILTALHVR